MSWSTRRAGRCRRTTRCGWSTTPGAEVAPGEEGELLVRGPYTLNGYYRADEANARSFSPDGFYRTGDRVRIFADGPRAGLCRGHRPHQGRHPPRRRDGVGLRSGGAPVRASGDLRRRGRRTARRVPRRKDLRGSRLQRPADLAGRTQSLPRRARRVRAFPARRARADADAAQDRGRQGGQEEGRGAAGRPDTRAVRTPRLRRLRRTSLADTATRRCGPTPPPRSGTPTAESAAATAPSASRAGAAGRRS